MGNQVILFKEIHLPEKYPSHEERVEDADQALDAPRVEAVQAGNVAWRENEKVTGVSSTKLQLVVKSRWSLF